MVPPDPETRVSEQRYAVVYVPRRNRNRFSASCVEVCANRDDALTKARPEEFRFAASVIGPSKSSEGQFLYYLVEWL